MPRAHRLRQGETVIGRAPACDLTITAPLMSRAHAMVRVSRQSRLPARCRQHVRHALQGAPLTAEQEIVSGDTFSVAQVMLTLEREVAEDELLSEAHQPLRRSGTILRPIDPAARLSPSTHAVTAAVPAPDGRTPIATAGACRRRHALGRRPAARGDRAAPVGGSPQSRSGSRFGRPPQAGATVAAAATCGC